MFPFYSLGYLYYLVPVLQIICILHALKTNRRDWIYLLIFLPGIGGIVYIIREILPGLRHSGMNNNGINNFFSGSRIKQLERNLKIADTDANKLLLAEEYARQQNFEKAIELTGSCLKGIYANNADMMLSMARYTFGAKQYTQSLEWLEKSLQQKKQRFDRPEDELLYAKTLHQSGYKARAEAAYQKMIQVHHSIEARYHYALLLKEEGRNEEARQTLVTLLEDRKLHPKYVRRVNAKWISASRKELTKLKAA